MVGNEQELEKRLAIICGTSSCHMGVSKQPRYLFSFFAFLLYIVDIRSADSLRAYGALTIQP